MRGGLPFSADRMHPILSLVQTIVCSLPCNPLTVIRAYRIANNSRLFDPTYYQTQLTKRLSSRQDPLVHYLATGAETRADPHPLFDTAYYLTQCPTVAEQGVNPLVHYLDKGGISGYSPSRQFDSAYYLRVYPVVKQHGLNPFVHYLTRGIIEDRYPLNDMYRVWMDENEKPTGPDGQSDRMEFLSARPLISVLMPTYSTMSGIPQLGIVHCRRRFD